MICQGIVLLEADATTGRLDFQLYLKSTGIGNVEEQSGC